MAIGCSANTTQALIELQYPAPDTWQPTKTETQRKCGCLGRHTSNTQSLYIN